MQYQVNKIQNLTLAIEKIIHILIKPEQTFSLWYLMGRPSKRNGYLKDLVLNNGRIGYD
jgi:vancomycin resistance protein VanW